MQRVIRTSICYHTRYRIFSLRFAWFWAICSGLLCVNVNFLLQKILVHIFYKFNGNPW